MGYRKVPRARDTARIGMQVIRICCCKLRQPTPGQQWKSASATHPCAWPLTLRDWATFREGEG